MVNDLIISPASHEKATIRQIAAEAGVSVRCVSRALSGQTKGLRRDAAERAERIRDLAQRMRYRRDLAAAATRNRRFGSIALVLSSGDVRRSNLPPNLLAAITDSLDDRDMHLSIARMSDAALTDPHRVPRLLRDFGADGLLVNYNQWVPQAMNQLIERHGLPAVWLNDKRPVDAVYPDDESAGRQATQYLLSLGHRRIVYVSQGIQPQSHYSERDRRFGYMTAMREAGLTDRMMEVAGGDDPMQPLREHLRGADRATAMLVYSSPRTAALLVTAAELGLHCPRDLSVMTFSGEFLRVGKPVTLMQIPDAQVGRLGIEMLIKRIDRPDHQRSVAVMGERMEGQTTAALKTDPLK